MTPEELREATTTDPPFTEPIDYLILPYQVARSIRWILTTSASHPDERLACVRALDIAIERHVRDCPKHNQ